MTPLLLLLAAAAASPVPFDEVGVTVTVPDAWPLIPELGDGIVGGFRDNLKLGNAQFTTGGKAYASTAQGVGLYVLWAVTDAAVQFPEPIIRAELDDLTERARLASIPVGTSEIVSFREELAARSAGAWIEYRVPANETRTLARALLFVDDQQRLHEVRVDCVLRDDVAATIRPGCEAALASLTITLPEARLAVIGKLPAAGAASAGAGAPPADEPKPRPSSDAPRLGNPTPGATVMPEAPVEDGGKKKTSRLLLYGGAGLIVLAAAMYFGRRRRHPGA